MDGIYKGVVFSLVLDLVYGAEWCITGSKFNKQLELCEYECCGDHCCPNIIPIIVGAVIGGLIFLAVLTAFIVCICCICKNNKGPPHTGRTIQPANTSPVYAQNPTYGHPPPPAYSQFSSFQNQSDRHPPPSYSQIYSTLPNSSPSAPPAYSDPAFPPGAVTGGTSTGFQSNPLPQL